MIGTNCRKQFKMGQLSERATFFGTTVVYEIQGLVRVERYFKPDEKRQLHDLLRYLFREYEYHGQQITARQMSYILGVDHTTVDNILARAKQKIKEGMHL